MPCLQAVVAVVVASAGAASAAVAARAADGDVAGRRGSANEIQVGAMDLLDSF